tara:strand:- start:3017 stop:3205 length:189 start_codon:yes stop_codon:yes gene_type:complete
MKSSSLGFSVPENKTYKKQEISTENVAIEVTDNKKCIVGIFFTLFLLLCVFGLGIWYIVETN